MPVTSVRWSARRLPHCGEVGEDQHLLAGGEHRLDDLLEPGQLARAAGQRPAVVLVGGRVVADLLERGDGGEDRALLGLAAAVGAGVGDQAVEHGLVEADLLGRHRAVVELVDAVGQLGGDLGLALGAAEHEDAVERPQRRLALARQLGDERGPGADEAGVGEVEDGPQVAEAVLDRRAGEGDAGAGRDAAQLLGGLVGRVLDGLRLVEHDPAPGDGGQGLDVADRGAVGGDDDVGAGDRVGRARGAAARGWRRGARRTSRPGVKRAASAAQLPTTAGGAMTRAGPSPARAGQVGEHGGRLAEAHVERQAAAELDRVEEAEPGERLGLVAAQLADEARRAGDRVGRDRRRLARAARWPSPRPRP